MSDAEGCCSSAAVPRGLTFCTVIAQHQKKSRVAPLTVALYFPDARSLLTHPPERKQPTVEHAAGTCEVTPDCPVLTDSDKSRTHLTNGVATHLSANLPRSPPDRRLLIQKSQVRSLSLSRYTGASRVVMLLLSHRSCRRDRVAVPANRALIRARGSLISWCAVCAVRCSTRVSSSQRGVPPHRGACAPSRRDHRSATAARPPCALSITRSQELALGSRDLDSD